MQRPLVLDTNVVLDLLVFRDPRVQPVEAALAGGALWLATALMREELERVLAYPKLAPRIVFHRGGPAPVLADFDRHARIVAAPQRAPVRCGDPDDQVFVDLAVAHGGLLLSKDREVLRMRKRLAALNVVAAAAWPAAPA